jgi:hypothetical protein
MVAVDSRALRPLGTASVVLMHDEGQGYEVEFMTLDGKTIAVATLRGEQVRAVQHDEIAHARSIAS